MAAFLLGDEVRVTTRHCKEPIGYSFSVRLEDRNVDVLFDKTAPVGTSISIELRDDIKAKWKFLIARALRQEVSPNFPEDSHTLLWLLAEAWLLHSTWRSRADSNQDLRTR